jgi:hypothetical protein
MEINQSSVVASSAAALYFGHHSYERAKSERNGIVINTNRKLEVRHAILRAHNASLLTDDTSTKSSMPRRCRRIVRLVRGQKPYRQRKLKRSKLDTSNKSLLLHVLHALVTLFVTELAITPSEERAP